jgi:uncharacterized membrane protein
VSNRHNKSSSPPGALVAKAEVTQVSGPLPQPDTLAKYNAIVPGAAERILAMAEEDARHLQAMERASLSGAYAERRTGQIFGLTIGLSALAVSIIAMVLGHELAAIAIGGTTVLGLVTVFVVGRVSKAD